jgi:hypothetical protein
VQDLPWSLTRSPKIFSNSITDSYVTYSRSLSAGSSMISYKIPNKMPWSILT